MQVQCIRLNSREFYWQFSAIIAEFGQKVPWLKGAWRLLHLRSRGRFNVLFVRSMRPLCGNVTAYGFVDDTGILLGGLLHCTKSPERFIDERNVAIAEGLTADGAGYGCCMQILPEHRGRGIGSEMMRQALAHIVATHGAVWGVAPSHRLRDWYVALGARSYSPEENTDNLWIVHWPTA